MIRLTTLAAAALICGAAATQASAQGAAQTVAATKVDPSSLATGFRASKVIGASVVNSSDETVGTVDDLIVTPTEKVPYAIVSVGGFLGVGKKDVAILSSDLQITPKRVMIPNATKDSLKALPEFTYQN
jgi:sporulation protein YlmC with PRC-barrel domain